MPGNEAREREEQQAAVPRWVPVNFQVHPVPEVPDFAELFRQGRRKGRAEVKGDGVFTKDTVHKVVKNFSTIFDDCALRASGSYLAELFLLDKPVNYLRIDLKACEEDFLNKHLEVGFGDFHKIKVEPLGAKYQGTVNGAVCHVFVADKELKPLDKFLVCRSQATYDLKKGFVCTPEAEKDIKEGTVTFNTKPTPEEAAGTAAWAERVGIKVVNPFEEQMKKEANGGW